MKNNSYTGGDINRSTNLRSSTIGFYYILSRIISTNTALESWYYSDVSSSIIENFTPLNKAKKIHLIIDADTTVSPLITNINNKSEFIEKLVPTKVI